MLTSPEIALAQTNNTLYSHDTAHHHDVAALPPLHVGKQLFHQPCQAKEVCVKELLHSSDTLALQWSDHASACIIN